MVRLDFDVIDKLFDSGVELLPNVNELFELELALLEYNNLPKECLLDRTAYIKSINGEYSKHYHICSSVSEKIQEGRSLYTRLYFSEGQFSTGYATHGLFPYHGKFHPQLIRALLNILGVERGDTILDPMAGSGTTNIEASLLGINSLAIDISPFCQFMIQVKYESLSINKEKLAEIKLDEKDLFAFFNKNKVVDKISKFDDVQKQKIYRLAFLAWLDALGYSKRVVRSNHEQLFSKVLMRYLEAVKSFINNPLYSQNDIGKATVLNCDALNMTIPDNSIDCVITSPPYSFAIDYVENDKSQLDIMGFDTDKLKEKMIGLKGKDKEEKISIYFKDIEKLCAETSRVIKNGKYFVVIIGSNTIQTGGVRLEQTIINSAKKYNMHHVRSIFKPIKGMRNIMEEKYDLTNIKMAV
jgi:DNA modification methylase